MTWRTRLLRFVAGFGFLLVMLIVLFALLIPMIHRWGATDAEVAQPMPGDDLVTDPVVDWTHGITIDAPPDEVWPWIIQMGDTRAGFYSYTFIENLVVKVTTDPSYGVVYRNANRIVPAWQDPQPGLAIIQDAIQIEQIQPGAWLLAQSRMPEMMNWVWVWQVRPIDGGQRTRLLVRMRIEIPDSAGMGNPAIGFFMDVGGFVMERGMMLGIKERAEGKVEPATIEIVEITLWLIALLCGLAGALMFVTRRAWQAPLALGVIAVGALFVFTFVQPPVWMRGIVDATLIAGGVWIVKRTAPESGSRSSR
jgi:hypothetical protein